jgi:hypothetical protein
MMSLFSFDWNNILKSEYLYALLSVLYIVNIIDCFVRVMATFTGCFQALYVHLPTRSYFS